jgi:(S)-ureidoglycine aminohydrolase
MHHLGHTRTTVRPNYTLQTPDSFVRAPLPGMTKASAIVHAAPALGSQFTMYTAELEASGQLGYTATERFVYVLEGELMLDAKGRNTRIGKGGYAHVPTDMPHRLNALIKTRAIVIEKPYEPLDNIMPPNLVVGKERTAPAQPLLGDKDVVVRSLIPSQASFDLAVNTMTYAPGATLPMVESHVMEHGLLMLDGGGIYRLGDDWHPVTAGDFIWMGPYCPQWFGALGKTPARYLIYKDWNRHPHS